MDTRLRLNLAACLSLLPLLPLTARLAQLQIMEHRNLKIRADDELDRSAIEASPRANILDRRGQILAQSLPVWAIFIDKHMIKNPTPLAQKLSRIINMTFAEIIRKYKTPGRFVWVNMDLSYEQAHLVSQAHLEGIGVVSRETRFYPNGDLAKSVLGQVSHDGRGIAGIELAQEARLKGHPRKFEMIRDGTGNTIYKDADQEPPPPKPITLTIDRNIQYYAEDILAQAAAKFSIEDGMIAVEDPNNGEILAMATYPPDPLKNSIIQDSYEPGSTFKLITSAAALNDSVVGENDSFFCENGTYEVAPSVFIHDHDPEGSLNIAGILSHSSNIGIAKVVERVGALRFYRYARTFGFANKTGIDLPGETSGEMRPLSEMTRVALAAASYGYGVGVSPLQILNAYSAIANGGTLWQPKIIKDGSNERIRRIVSPQTAQILSGMLEGVVEDGTGIAARIPGYRVAGKTGTARRMDPNSHKYSMSSYNASFVGFLPVSHPRWAILVLIGNPKGQFYGAEVAAPFFGKLAQRLLALEAVPPDAPIEVRLQTAMPVRNSLLKPSFNHAAALP